MQGNYLNVSNFYPNYNRLVGKISKIWFSCVKFWIWLKINLHSQNIGGFFLGFNEIYAKYVKISYQLCFWNQKNIIQCTNYLHARSTLQVRKLILQDSNTVELWKKPSATHEICRIFTLKETHNGYEKQRNKPLHIYI